jgi:hypothetical protein
MSTPLATVPERVQTESLSAHLKIGGIADCHKSGSIDALVRVRNSTEQYLDFCGHCFRVNEVALAVAGWSVVSDYR